MTRHKPALELPHFDLTPADRGRFEALRSFTAHYTTMKGDALEDLATVQNGTADPAFKAAFVETLTALAALFRSQPEPVQPRLVDGTTGR